MLGDIQDVYLGDVRAVYPQDGAGPRPGPGNGVATVPTHHMPQAVANIAGSLAIGMDAGTLLIRPGVTRGPRVCRPEREFRDSMV